VRDRLAFAVRVRRQKHGFGVLRLAPQILDDLALAAYRDVFGRESPRDIDAQLALRQVTDVADRRPDPESRAQVLADRPRLRRRFDDHEPRPAFALRHPVPYPTLSRICSTTSSALRPSTSTTTSASR